jgi:hypothetical protein
VKSLWFKVVLSCFCWNCAELLFLEVVLRCCWSCLKVVVTAGAKNLLNAAAGILLLLLLFSVELEGLLYVELLFREGF